MLRPTTRRRSGWPLAGAQAVRRRQRIRLCTPADGFFPLQTGTIPGKKTPFFFLASFGEIASCICCMHWWAVCLVSFTPIQIWVWLLLVSTWIYEQWKMELFFSFLLLLLIIKLLLIIFMSKMAMLLIISSCLNVKILWIFVVEKYVIFVFLNGDFYNMPVLCMYMCDLNMWLIDSYHIGCFNVKTVRFFAYRKCSCLSYHILVLCACVYGWLAASSNMSVLLKIWHKKMFFSYIF